MRERGIDNEILFLYIDIVNKCVSNMPFFDFSVDNGGILSYFIPIKWQLFNKMPNL